MTAARFRKAVWEYARRHGRHSLPWRAAKTSPYHVLVSEVMLQQTQVDRVTPFYTAFIARFPDIAALAAAPLAAVLREWQGLGYNRRAKHLHEAAKAIEKRHAGKVPRTVAELEALPGVGPYTARAIAAFAYNTDTVFIETNLRTAVMHHFFPKKEGVSDAEMLEVLAKVFPKGKARAWYAALMDYGSSLKRSGVRINSRAKAYARQKPFKGSLREARGAALRALGTGPKGARALTGLLGDGRKAQMQEALGALLGEGLIEKRAGRYRLP